MRFTTVHINAILVVLVVGVISGGLLWVLIHNDITDHRFVEVIAILGFCVKGLVDVAKNFSDSDENNKIHKDDKPPPRKRSR